MLGIHFEVDTVFAGPSPDFDPSGELEGYTSFLVYADFTNPTDVLGAIYADVDNFPGSAPLAIDAPCGCWNPDSSSVGIGTTVSSSFLPLFPRFEYDSFWTIGKLFVDDPGQTPIWVSAPQIDGSNFCNTLVNNGVLFVTGTTGSWPVNAIAGEDLKILIARITSCGEVSLTVNAQVYIEGNPNSTQNWLTCEIGDLDYDGICDDIDDCVGLYDACGVCNGPGPLPPCGCGDADNDGICDDIDLPGCTNSNACNYDENANIDDGSCQIPGCTNPNADNYNPFANEDDGSCTFGGGLSTGLSYDVVSADPLGTGKTTYRIYGNFSSDDLEVTAMYGTDTEPWILDGDAPFYQDALGSDFGGSVNPLFFASFPTLEYDTWWTIGAQPGDADGLNNAFDPALTSFADWNNGGNFVVNTELGGSLFIVAGANGQGNPVNGRVLLAQVTTSGTTNATINLQFRDANQNSFFASGMTLTFPNNSGILDSCNECINDSDGDGICDELEVSGCTLEFACNYDPLADIDDGSCEFFCPGCTDESACNYDSGAIQEDGSCTYPGDLGFCDCEGNQLDAVGVCGGFCAEDVDEDGICDDVDECIGEFDECGICQGPGAIYACGCADAPEGFCDCDGNVLDECGVCGGSGIPEGDCDCAGNVLDECGVCGGMGIPEGECDCNGNVVDECGVCGGDGSTLDECGVCNGDNSSCTGCTYEFACNYDASATILDVSSCEFGVCGGCTQLTACNYNPTVLEDDGSCEWCSCIDADTPDDGFSSCGGAGNPEVDYWIESEAVVVHTSGELEGMTTYRLYVMCQNDLDFVAACGGDDENPLIVESSSGSWYNNEYNSFWNASGLIPAFFSLFPTMVYDSYLTIGAEDGNSSQQPTAVYGEIDFRSQFDGDGPGENFTVDDETGGAWFTIFSGLEEASSDAAFAGEDLRVLIAQITTAGVISGQVYVQLFKNGSWEDELRGVMQICPSNNTTGCTDPDASNYCELVNVEDGSCIYDYVGCTDESACNYSATASVSDQNLCVYIPEGECDCEGNVLDECGVCGGDGVPEGECDCAGNVLDECGVCGGDGIPEGECDCEGNVLDECGVCGGEGIAEGECDCEGNVLDECGVCGGPGIAEGACDCEGNVLDALGVCGGDCLTDQNNNGICDLTELENPMGGPETCGLGTVWDEETQTCIVAYPADINFDGCVQLNDLLDLLSAYGLCQDD